MMFSAEIERLLSSALPKNKSLAYWQLIVLIGLTLVRGLIYLSLFPPWIAPDEPAHFEAVRIIGQEGQLPSFDYYESTPVNAELSQSFFTFRMWELLERATPSQRLQDGSLDSFSFIYYPYPGKLVYADTYPILPHIVLSPISSLATPLDIATELYILRFVSILFAVCITIISWFVIRRAFPNQPQFWLAIPAFIIFLPMYTHIFASLNTDVFAILLTSLVLLVFILFFDQGMSKFKVTLLLGLLILALFIKRTVVFTLLWAGVVGVLYLGYRNRWPLKRVVRIEAITAGVMAIALACVIANSELLADSFITLFNMNIGSDFSFVYIKGLSLSEIIVMYIKSGLFAFITFWGNFGGATTNIPWSWAWGLMALCAVVVFGAGRYLYRAFTSAEEVSSYQKNVFIVFIAGIVLSLLNAFFPVLVAGPSWGPPARYFFPMIIPIATFFFLGTWHLFPAKYRQVYLLPLWLAALVTYDTLVVSQVLIPFLYG